MCIRDSNWIGVSYYYARMYDSALYHYQAALKIAREKLSLQRNIYTTGEDDYTVSDYDRIYNFYTNTGNKTKAEQYKILYNAELQKVTELYATPALHIIALNGTSRPGEYSGKNNAGAFFQSISGIQNKENQKSFNKLVNGSEINREKLTGLIDLVRINSKPEDIFVFYYSGENSNSNGQHYLDFNTKDTAAGRIAITELMDHIDLVYANKKMVITDLPNPSLLNLITTKYASTGNNSAEIISSNSRTLSAIVYDFNKHSVNFIGEILLKYLGAYFKGAPGTAQKGAEVIKKEFFEFYG
mgnify:CR=1 FL=1